MCLILIVLGIPNAEAYIVTYYLSGNLESVQRGDATYIYLDEDHWGRPTPQGRLWRIEYSDGSIYEYSYYADDPTRIRRISYGSSSAATPYIREYYNEDFYRSRMLRRTRSGGSAVAYEYFTGSLYTYRLKRYDPDGVEDLDIAIGDDVRAIDIDRENSIIVSLLSGSGDVILAKYLSDGTPDWQETDATLGWIDAVTVDSDNSPHLIARPSSSDTTITLIKFLSDGTEDWRKTYDFGSGTISIADMNIKADGIVHTRAIRDDGSGPEGFEIVYSPYDDTFVSEALDNCHYADHVYNTGRRRRTGDIEYYAYALNSDLALVEYHYSFLTGLGGATVLYYYGGDGNRYGMQAGIDDGRSLEFMIFGDETRLTKAVYPGNDIYWFLWGDDVYEGHDNVVIEQTSFGEWYAYTFTPDLDNPDVVLNQASWVLIGSVSAPEALTLPELGDWITNCSIMNIVPEFPPVSSEYAYDNDKVIKRTDDNPYMNTVYSYTWDYKQPGRVRIDMDYDYDENDNNIVYSWIYQNDTDYNVNNTPFWLLLMQINHLNDSANQYVYWPDRKLHYMARFGPGYNWLETIEYWEDGHTMHHHWLPDADPGNPGDPVLTIYDESGRVIEQRFDDTSIIRNVYWGSENDNVHYYGEWGPAFEWIQTIEYWEDGVKKHNEWLADQNTGTDGDVVIRIYDDQERTVEERFDDTGIKKYWYWDATGPEVRYYAEYGPGFDWLKTIEYWEDGATYHYIWLKDPDGTPNGDVVFEEYNVSGELIRQILDTGEEIILGGDAVLYDEGYADQKDLEAQATAGNTVGVPISPVMVGMTQGYNGL